MRKEGGSGEGEGDDGHAVEVEKHEDGVLVGMVDDGALARRHEEYARDQDTTERQRRREPEHPREPVQVALHAHQLHRLLRVIYHPRCVIVALCNYLSRSYFSSQNRKYRKRIFEIIPTILSQVHKKNNSTTFLGLS